MGQAAREEEMMIFQFLPTNSSHRQVILGRMVERLKSRVNRDGAPHAAKTAWVQEKVYSDGDVDE